MKKSRKKMLLSSIAMLLVALVALGSATFAWYASQTTVTADMTTWSAAAATGLVIKHEAADSWSTEIHNLKTASSLSPRAIQFTDGDETDPQNIPFDDVVGASATATSRTSYAASSHSLINHDTLLTDTNYIVDHMFVASESGPVNVSMSVKANKAADADSYLNLAIYVDGELVEVFSTSTGKTKDLAVNNGTASEGDEYTTTALSTSAQRVGGSSFTFQAATAANGGTGTEVQIIAYADGFNSKCTTSTFDVSSWQVDYSFSIAA